MQIFEVRGEREGERVRIHAGGELDVATVPCLEACAREYLQGHAGAVELDLRELGFIDSTGVQLLLTLMAEGQRDGWALELLPSDAVRRIICLLGLQPILRRERQLEAAPTAEGVLS